MHDIRGRIYSDYRHVRGSGHPPRGVGGGTRPPHGGGPLPPPPPHPPRPHPDPDPSPGGDGMDGDSRDAKKNFKRTYYDLNKLDKRYQRLRERRNEYLETTRSADNQLKVARLNRNDAALRHLEILNNLDRELKFKHLIRNLKYKQEQIGDEFVDSDELTDKSLEDWNNHIKQISFMKMKQNAELNTKKRAAKKIAHYLEKWKSTQHHLKEYDKATKIQTMMRRRWDRNKLKNLKYRKNENAITTLQKIYRKRKAMKQLEELKKLERET